MVLTRRGAGRRSGRLALGAAGAACLAFAAAASRAEGPVANAASETPPAGDAAADPDDWQFALAAYGWATDMTGTVRADRFSADVDPQLWNDILKNLNGALMGAVEANYRGRWLVNLDLFGASLDSEAEKGPFPMGFGPRTFTRRLPRVNTVFPVETDLGTVEVPVRIDPGTLRVDVPRVETAIGPFDVDVETLMVQARAQLGYRLVDLPAVELLGEEPGEDGRRVRVDLFAGLRYWYLKSEIDVDSPPVDVPAFTVTSSISGGRARVGGQLIPPQTVALPTVRLPDLEFGPVTFGGTDVDETASTWWIDPLVGLRVGADLTERIGIVVAGNVGGFDIGSASKFSWEALALLDWRFGETTSFVLGYRGIGIDRQKGRAETEVILHGPLLGLLFRF